MRSTQTAVDKGVRKIYITFSVMWNVFWNVGVF